MPDTVETDIAEILMGHLLGYASAASLQVSWPNVTFAPPAATYLKVDLLWNRNVNRGIPDDSSTEHRGIFQVTVVAAANSGLKAPTNIAGAVAAHFERGLIPAAAGLKVRTEGKPSLGPSQQEADRMRLPVSVRFYAIT